MRWMPLIATGMLVLGLLLPAAASAQAPPDPCLLIFEVEEATIVGTDGNDTIRGTEGSDVILAGAGNDLCGASGATT